MSRRPYVGEGADGCRRSAEIDRAEADTLATGPHQPGWDGGERRASLLASAERWEEQARAIEAAERGWCVRCGHPYEPADYLGPGLWPVCEHAGDPPVDRESDDWRRYVERVRALRYVPPIEERV